MGDEFALVTGLNVTHELTEGPIASLIRARGAAREPVAHLDLADPPAVDELRDSFVDAYLGARRGLITLTAWVEQLLDPAATGEPAYPLDADLDAGMEAGGRNGSEEAHRSWAQMVAFGLCAPLFEQLSADHGDWVWQRATHGNLHDELDDLDVGAARDHAEDSLEQTLLGVPIGYAMAGIDLDGAMSFAWNPLETLGGALDAMAYFGGLLGADPVALTEAADASAIARIGERVEKRFYEEFLQVGHADAE